MVKPKINKKKVAKEEAELRRQEEERLRLIEEQNQKKIMYLYEKKMYNLRCGMLADTIKWIDNLKESIDRLEEISLKERKWKLYLSCDELPNVNKPKDIRDYLFKWFYLDLQEELMSRDWCLRINERSVLTQDQTNKNLTKKFLQTMEHDIGDQFAKRTKDILKILDQIEIVLEKPENLPLNVYTELVSLKQEIRTLLRIYIDIYTFRILCNINRDMERIDQITAEYIFQSDLFSKYLWTLRDLPMPDKNEETEINLVSINANMTIPIGLPLQNSAIRGICLCYDHYSDYAPSYKLIDYTFDGDNLRDAIIKEWEKRKELNLNHLNIMKQDRIEWEQAKNLEAAAALAREQPKSKKNTIILETKPKNSKKSKKAKKEVRPEPPIVNDDTIIDVDEEYCELEYANYKEMLTTIGPESFSLKPNDINLRHFNIYGGIYCFHYLEQPKQSLQLFNNYILRQIYMPNVLKFKQYYEEFNYPKDEDIIDPLLLKEIENDKAKLIEIKIKLPDNVCWWEVPVVCRWEIWEESEEFLALNPRQQYYNLHYDDIMKEKQLRLFNSSYLHEIKEKISHAYDDFNMDEIPKNIHLQFLIENEILPRLPSDYQFQSELVEEEKRLAKIQKKKMMLLLEEKAERMDNQAKAEQATDELLLKINEMEQEGNPMDEEEIQVEMNKIANMFVRDNDNNRISKRNKIKVDVTYKNACNLFPEPTQIPDIIINPMPDTPFVEYRIETDLKLEENECILFSKFLENLAILRNKEKPIIIDHSLVKHENVDAYLEEDITDPLLSKTPQSIKKITKTTGKYTSKPEINSNTKIKISKDSKKKVKTEQDEEEAVSVQEVKTKLHLELLPHAIGKWTTNNIFHQSYDPTTNILTFRTGKLGVFGLAASKYYNFPYKKWELKPNPDAPMSVIFSIFCKKIDFNIIISTFGFLIVLPPKTNLPIKLPTKPISLKQLKKLLFNAGINIFPERDAACYIDEKEIIEKHYQMEMHMYKCIGPYCLTHNFASSEWNRFSNYRTALIKIREIEEHRDISEFEIIKLTPLNITVVTIIEKCTDLSTIELEYTQVYDNQEFVPDLYKYLVNHSNEYSRRKQEDTKIKLRWNVIQLLMAVRPISFS